MRSDRPKPLHLLCGRPLLLYMVDTLVAAEVDRVVVVVGAAAEQVTKRILRDVDGTLVDFVEQPVPRGTADAVQSALGALPDDDLGDDDVLVVPADMPLLSTASLRRLVEAHRAGDVACTVLTVRSADPTGSPRVVRGRDGRVVRLAGDADVLADERSIDEVAVSVLCARRSLLGAAIRRVTPSDDDGSYRLEDVVEVLARAGHLVAAVEVEPVEVVEVDDRLSLAEVEAELRRRINRSWLAAGVSMLDPSTCYIDATVELGRDVTLFPGTLLQGRTVVGAGAEIGPNARLVDCVVGAGARVQHTVATDAEIGDDAVVGPFVVLDPGARVEAGARVVPGTAVRLTDRI